MANSVILIRPTNFAFNRETAKDNSFANDVEQDVAQKAAAEEFKGVVDTLKDANIHVIVFDDFKPSLGPDSIFPNNWFSTHENGMVVKYPMCHLTRRKERRDDIVDYLRQHFKVTEYVDLSPAENKHEFLEGTGSLVLDHSNKVCYAALSQRTNKDLVLEICKKIGYEPVLFNTKHELGGQPIYHTNVLMGVGRGFIVCCMDLIEHDELEKAFLRHIEMSRKKLVNISPRQVEAFAGNILQVYNRWNVLCTIMSDRAYHSLTEEQLDDIREDGEIFHSGIPTIESIGGGGIRCMMAEVFLEPKE